MPPCNPRVVVLDFDGTLTDADLHCEPFHDASRCELGRMLGWDSSRTREEWSRAASVLESCPGAAWQMDGRAVCPAAADPYLIANSICKRLLLEHRGVSAEVDELVFRVHRTAYERVAPSFRPEARAVLEALTARDYQVWVVTNSHTANVVRRIDALDLRGRDRVRIRGSASKFTVCGCTGRHERFQALPETVHWAPLERCVYLRRGRYFDILREIWDACGAGPSSTLVVGDIFELDLAMPYALGAHVHLVLRKHTVPHERAWADKMERGSCAGSLESLFDRLEMQR